MYILFDIGATKIRVAGARDSDSFENLKTIRTPENFEEGMETLISLIREMGGGEEIEAIAGGIAGSYSREQKKLLVSPNMKGWVNKPFGKILEEEFGAPVHVDNDTAMAVMGESLRGAGKEYKIVGYVTVSTGVGGSRAVNGKVDERAITYEPGHQVLILPDGEAKTL
jgi:glucokinase